MRKTLCRSVSLPISVSFERSGCFRAASFIQVTALNTRGHSCRRFDHTSVVSYRISPEAPHKTRFVRVSTDAESSARQVGLVDTWLNISPSSKSTTLESPQSRYHPRNMIWSAFVLNADASNAHCLLRAIVRWPVGGPGKHYVSDGEPDNLHRRSSSACGHGNGRAGCDAGGDIVWRWGCRREWRLHEGHHSSRSGCPRRPRQGTLRCELVSLHGTSIANCGHAFTHTHTHWHVSHTSTAAVCTSVSLPL